MELNTIRDIAYRNAKSKGFYLSMQDDMSYIAAIHEELSEAFSAWNKNNFRDMKVWYHLSPKPDGIYFELTDAVIRTLSFCGYKGYDLKTYNVGNEAFTKDDLCDVICRCHAIIGQYYDVANKEYSDEYESLIAQKCISRIFSSFIALISRYINQSSNSEYKLYDLIDTKLKYNQTRSMLHGGHKV